MPVLRAHDSLGRLLQPGDRVAVPIPAESPAETTWRGGTFGTNWFHPWKLEREALILLSRGGETITALAAVCQRLGSREEISW